MDQLEGRVIKLPHRSTRMGGLTLPVAMRIQDGKIVVVEPVHKIYSRTGRHGTWIYIDIDCYLLLEQSNSGKRSAIIRCKPEYDKLIRHVVDSVVDMWLNYMISYEEVIERLQQASLLKS